MLIAFIHTNIRSMSKNLNEFQLYLKMLNYKSCDADTFPIQNYKHEYALRRRKQGGSVSLYIRDIPHTLRDDCTFDKDKFESIFIEVNKTKSTFSLKRNVIIQVFLVATLIISIYI